MRTIPGALLVFVFVAAFGTQALAQNKGSSQNKGPYGAEDWWFVQKGKADPAGCDGICFRKYPDVGRGPELDRLACREECKANPAKFGAKVSKPATKPAKGN